MSDQRLLQPLHRRHAGAAAVPPAAQAAARRHHFAQRRKVGHAHFTPALNFQADQHRVKRYAAHKRARAIDGVDDPAVRTGPAGIAKFFANNGVAGEFLFDAGANQLFGFAVGHGYRRFIGFKIGPEAGLVVAQG